MHIYPLFLSAPEPIKVDLSDKKIDYIKDVKPILDKRCVVCHSCYNSPCQAKFSSFEGVDRGGSKIEVYAKRWLFEGEPTRLFVDKNQTADWQEKDFFSLTSSDAKEGYNNSIMAHMLHDRKVHNKFDATYIAERKDLICAQGLNEVTQYQNRADNNGMPFGFPSLKEEEYQTIMQWLAQGAKRPLLENEKKLKTPSEPAQVEINRWEKFLNNPDAKHVMTARYLYEHYFLAHLMFSSAPNEFYQLIRSSTSAPKKPNTLKTLRPYDKPEIETFYYRFEKIHSTIVHKTHMVVEFDEEEFTRINNLFIDTKWLKEPHVMSYDNEEENANPFLIYAQIPPDSRYRFMLDHNEYFVRTFIRGPICKGNIALSVIRDHFWIIFQNPEYDIGANRPEFLQQQEQNLRLPIEKGSGYFSLWALDYVDQIADIGEEYKDKYKRYYDAKMRQIVEFYPDGMPLDSIWKGRRAKDAPALTAYRHYDSGSVLKGTLGKLPKTIWLMDYAQLERLYYTLVAGFDVYGSVSHQMEVRRYMDFFRLEGELNYLSYLPSKSRGELLEEYYQGKGIVKDIQSKDEAGYTAKIRAQYPFKTDSVKQEFIENLVDRHFIKEANIYFDKINYFRRGEKVPSLPQTYASEADLIQGLRSLTKAGTGFIKYMVGTDVNLAYIRVKMKDGRNIVGTFIVNRWHDNVNALLKEKKRFNSAKDTLDVLEGSVGSYPNAFFVVKEEELPDFFDMVQNFNLEDETYLNKAKKYAISRSDKDFWKHYDWFQNRFNEDEPRESGLYDLNRYYKRTW